MSEGKAGRGASFSMLFVAELVAQAAVGCGAVRLVAGPRLDDIAGEGRPSLFLAYLAFPFLTAFGAMQGLAVLVERARGRGRPWGVGRWAVAFLALSFPLEFVFMWKYGDMRLENFGSFAEVDRWVGLYVSLREDVADFEMPFLVALLIALHLGRDREERARAVVDAREWVGRGLVAALVSCFLALTALDFLGH